MKRRKMGGSGRLEPRPLCALVLVSGEEEAAEVTEQQ